MTEGGAMVGWILIGVFYVLGFGLFGLAGGLGGAAEAFQRWGRASSRVRSSAGSSS
jgi:hypothetical protein